MDVLLDDVILFLLCLWSLERCFLDIRDISYLANSRLLDANHSKKITHVLIEIDSSQISITSNFLTCSTENVDQSGLSEAV